MRNVVYCPPAMQFFGRLAADALGYELAVGTYVGDCDDCHIVGMYDPPLYDQTLKNTQRAKRRIIHWCGTDVLLLEDGSALPEAIHVCDSNGLRSELWEKGVRATTVMWPTRHHPEVTPFPEKPQIACYLGTQPIKYGVDMLTCLGDVLLEDMPDVSVIGYQFGEHGEDGMKQLISDSWLTIRLTHHDGSAASPREFMEAGRRAIVTHELPFAKRIHPDDLNELIRAVKLELKHTEPDLRAAAYWREQNSTSRFLAELKEALDG